MPRKLNTKRKARKTKRSFRRPRKTSDLVIYKSVKQNPVPPRLRTQLALDFYGAAASGAASGHYFCGMNFMYQSLASGGWPGASLTIATANPFGFTALCNTNLYRRYRVYGSRIEVEFLPQALTDTVEVTVTPSQLSTSPASVALGMSQRQTVSGFNSSNKNNMNSKKGSALVNYITQHKLLGVSYQAIKDDLSQNYTGGAAAAPGVPMYWVVNWQTPDAVTLAVILEYRVRIRYDVEFYQFTGSTLDP